MNKEWQEFLLSQGAVMDNESNISFPASDQVPYDPETNYLCDLSNLGLIKASGEDATSFLHGQFTNDLHQVDPNSTQLSSYCNPKGRMHAIFRVIKRDDEYILLMPRDVIEVVAKKLNMFKLMAKVEIEDISDQLIVFGLTGPNSDTLLKKNNIQLPSEHNQSSSTDQTIAIKIASHTTRTLIISSPEKAKVIWESMADQCTQSNQNTWGLIDIQNGIPEITAETNEAFIPQMVNLELIGGVNFQKGCYPGQEIVARTHYLGKPNRRMYRINIETDACPMVGDNIFSVADGEQPVGKIVSAQKASNNTCEALAVLRTAKENADDLHVSSLTDASVKFANLPYSLDAD